MGKQYYVYIMTNKNNTVLYTGIKNDLIKRVWEHKNSIGSAFTKKYNICKLVYCEVFDNPIYAIEREKKIKAGAIVKNFMSGISYPQRILD